MCLGGLGIQAIVACYHVVERPVLIGGTGIVSDLHHTVEQLLRCRAELLLLILRRRFWPRDGPNELITWEGVDLVEGDNGHHQPVTQLGRRQWPTYPNDDVHIGPPR